RLRQPEPGRPRHPPLRPDRGGGRLRPHRRVRRRGRLGGRPARHGAGGALSGAYGARPAHRRRAARQGAPRVRGDGTGSFGGRVTASEREARLMRPRGYLGALLAVLALGTAHAQVRELVVAQGIDVKGFDVHSSGSSVTAEESVLVNVFDYLVWRTADGDFEPGLAVSWEPIADDAWRFELREGVVWHDGQPFTAEDVKFTLERISRDESL